MIFSTIDFIYPVLAETALADETVIFSALLISALVILLTSQLLGELCAWLKLPPVLGQLVGGIVLGVSVLKILVLVEGDAAINPSIIDLICWTTGGSAAEAAMAYQHQLIAISEGAANLGVIALLFLIGLESDFESLLKVGPKAAIVAGAGVVLPFVGGTAGLIALFGTPLLPAIFGGAALTATSIGITAKVLKELGQLQSEEGQIIIGAAVLDDLLGILVLALVVSLVKEGSINVAGLGVLLLSTTAFVAGVALLRMPIIRAFTAITDKLQSEDTLLVSAIVFALFMAAIANAIHLEAILGAFAAGVILSGMPHRHHLLEKFEPVAGLLAPLFFVVVGAKTDLSVLNPAHPSSAAGLWIASFLIIIAVVGKVAAGYFIPNSGTLNRLAIGLGMVPRGEVGLVFVGIGSSIGILSSELAAAVVLMVVVTTLIALLLLRFALPESAPSSPAITEAVSDS